MNITRKKLEYKKIVFPGTIGNQYETKEYNKFNFIDVNRNVNEESKAYKNIYAQLAEDKEMLEGSGVVDKYGNIADGQNRLIMCKRLEIPFKFMLVENTTLEMIKRINNNRNPWNYMTACMSQIAAKNKNYKQYLKFRKATPELKTHNVWKMFLSQKRSNPGWDKGLYKAGNFSIGMRLYNIYAPILGYFNKKGRQQEFAKAFMKAVISPSYGGKFDNKRFQNGLKEFIKCKDDSRNKTAFGCSSEDKPLNFPQQVTECNRLINDIWNFNKTGKDRTELLPYC